MTTPSPMDARILIVYHSDEGQTAKIAERFDAGSPATPTPSTREE